MEPTMCGRGDEKGEQSAGRGRLPAAPREGGGIANGGLRRASCEKDAGMLGGTGIAAIDQADIRLAGLDGGQNHARIIEEQRTLANGLPQSERLQISARVMAKRTRGI